MSADVSDVEIRVCFGNDFDGWNTKANNPTGAPVVQRQELFKATTSHEILGGWVLREPPTQSDNWVEVPLQCRDTEADAIRAARRHLAGLDPELP
ncbi:hypothetical protein QN239_20345 [Mycolicibacterium sp. Y3]